MRKHKSIGSDFDDWLEAEGILEEVEIAATKKAFVIQLQAEMKKKKDWQISSRKNNENQQNSHRKIARSVSAFKSSHIDRGCLSYGEKTKSFHGLKIQQSAYEN